MAMNRTDFFYDCLYISLKNISKYDNTIKILDIYDETKAPFIQILLLDDHNDFLTSESQRNRIIKANIKIMVGFLYPIKNQTNKALEIKIVENKYKDIIENLIIKSERGSFTYSDIVSKANIYTLKITEFEVNDIYSVVPDNSNNFAFIMFQGQINYNKTLLIN